MQKYSVGVEWIIGLFDAREATPKRLIKQILDIKLIH